MRLGVVAGLAVGILAVPAGTASPSISHVIASAPTWSPDGATLAYAEEIPTANPRFDVVVGSAAGGRSHMLASGAARPQWSPDGGAIAYIGRDQSSGNLSELWIADVSSLVDGRDLVTTDVATFAWSADGEQLFYDTGDTCGPLRVVSRYDFSKARVVVTGATPAPSPDGKLLAYLTPPSPGRCTGGVGYLSVAHVDGTDARVVLPEPALRLSWSPDSARLAVEVQSNEGPRIVLVDRDGSHPTLVASGSHRRGRRTAAGSPSSPRRLRTPRSRATSRRCRSSTFARASLPGGCFPPPRNRQAVRSGPRTGGASPCRGRSSAGVSRKVRKPASIATSRSTRCRSRRRRGAGASRRRRVTSWSRAARSPAAQAATS